MFTVSVPTNEGVNATFWRVTAWPVIDMLGGNITITVSGWASQEAYNAGNATLSTFQVILSAASIFSAIASNPSAPEQAVDQLIIAAVSQFTGATQD